MQLTLRGPGPDTWHACRNSEPCTYYEYFVDRTNISITFTNPPLRVGSDRGRTRGRPASVADLRAKLAFARVSTKLDDALPYPGWFLTTTFDNQNLKPTSVDFADGVLVVVVEGRIGSITAVRDRPDCLTDLPTPGCVVRVKDVDTPARVRLELPFAP